MSNELGESDRQRAKDFDLRLFDHILKIVNDESSEFIGRTPTVNFVANTGNLVIEQFGDFSKVGTPYEQFISATQGDFSIYSCEISTTLTAISLINLLPGSRIEWWLNQNDPHPVCVLIHKGEEIVFHHKLDELCKNLKCSAVSERPGFMDRRKLIAVQTQENSLVMSTEIIKLLNYYKIAELVPSFIDLNKESELIDNINSIPE